MSDAALAPNQTAAASKRQRVDSASGTGVLEAPSGAPIAVPVGERTDHDGSAQSVPCAHEANAELLILKQDNALLRRALMRAERDLAEYERIDAEREERILQRSNVPPYQKSRAIAAVVARSSEHPYGTVVGSPLVRNIVDGSSECTVLPHLVALPDFSMHATGATILLERRHYADASIVSQIKNSLNVPGYNALDLLVARLCESVRCIAHAPTMLAPRQFRILLCWCESVRTLTFNIDGHIVINLFMAPAHAQSFIHFASSFAHALVHNHVEPHGADARTTERMILARLADDIDLVACYDAFQREWFRRAGAEQSAMLDKPTGALLAAPMPALGADTLTRGEAASRYDTQASQPAQHCHVGV